MFAERVMCCFTVLRTAGVLDPVGHAGCLRLVFGLSSKHVRR